MTSVRPEASVILGALALMLLACSSTIPPGEVRTGGDPPGTTSECVVLDRATVAARLSPVGGHEPQPCQSTSDCDPIEGWGDGVCTVAGVTVGCGGSRAPECATDEDCGAQRVCASPAMACSARACVDDCREVAAACDAGRRCDASTGHCVPRHCATEAVGCAPNSRCAPDAPGDGCIPLECVSDGDCDCGYCVNGRCATAPGYCSYGAAA